MSQFQKKIPKVVIIKNPTSTVVRVSKATDLWTGKYKTIRIGKTDLLLKRNDTQCLYLAFINKGFHVPPDMDVKVAEVR
jgi:hypothetical protein